MDKRTLTAYAVAVIVVMILGSLAGWYFFLRTQTENTVAQDAARGYGAVAGRADGIGATAGSGGIDASAPIQAPKNESQGFFSRMYGAIFGNVGISGSEPANSFGSSYATSDESGALSASSTAAETPAKKPPQLWQVTAAPIAGMSFSGNATGTRLRYVERASGHIFEVDPDTGTNTRLTHTLMPKVYEAQFAASRIIMRSLDEGGGITTYSARIATSTEGATSTLRALTGTYLPKNILTIAANPRTGGLFYLTRTAGGVTGTRAESDGSKPKDVFTSAIIHWRVQWTSDDRIVLSTAAADGVVGSAYLLQGDGSLDPIVTGVPGLTGTFKRVGGPFLLSQSGAGGLSTTLQLSGSSTRTQIPVRTLSEKCTWAPVGGTAYCGVPQTAPTGAVVDAWYRGIYHSADAIYRVDGGAGSATAIFTPETGTSLDVINPAIDASGRYIAFQNGADMSLWLFRITP